MLQKLNRLSLFAILVVAFIGVINNACTKEADILTYDVKLHAEPIGKYTYLKSIYLYKGSTLIKSLEYSDSMKQVVKLMKWDSTVQYKTGERLYYVAIGKGKYNALDREKEYDSTLFTIEYSNGSMKKYFDREDRAAIDVTF